ncbi:helix-turn-helix domain-containing protein [Streptomyces sp. NPDC052225]|uniref:TetR/AcrR family transcriptional regulator n=1 Tax=Streptomyces sp. NPDC052225 TaxID=3154949 RepID=UPI00342D70D2
MGTLPVRREQVVRAAVAEFAAGGFHGTTTAVIAARVGVSQPYLYRLFPDKRALFTAAAEHCFDVLARTLEAACRGLRGERARAAVDLACSQLVAQRREIVLLVLQLAAAAPSLPEDGRQLRAAWLALGDGLAARTGLSARTFGVCLARSLAADALRGAARPSGRGALPR